MKKDNFEIEGTDCKNHISGHVQIAIDYRNRWTLGNGHRMAARAVKKQPLSWLILISSAPASPHLIGRPPNAEPRGPGACRVYYRTV